MAFLGNVRIGDEVKFTTVDGEETEYRVSGAMVVDSSHWSPQSDPEGTLYMVTCWPLDGQETTSKRLVVVARHNLGGADDTALYLRGRASETMVKSVVFLHPRLLILRNSCQTFPMRNLKL
jgi:hypothetical protein